MVTNNVLQLFQVNLHKLQSINDNALQKWHDNCEKKTEKKKLVQMIYRRSAKFSTTACAIANPSCVDVPRPNSSKTTRELEVAERTAHNHKFSAK